MNVRISALVLVSLLIGFSSVWGQEANPATIEYMVTADTANIRAGAGTSFAVVDSVQRGDRLLIYAELPEVEGWLRIYQVEGNDVDGYIANFLVERAPEQFYPPQQQPIFVVSGRGRDISDTYEVPRGAYRIDASVQDQSFILEMVVVEGNCRDISIFNELNFDVSSLNVSALLISEGCSIIFQTDNVDGNWEFAIRSITEDVVLENAKIIENGTTLSGLGRVLTMPTFLAEGIWSISATVQDQAFILHSRPIGDCDEESVFNELDFDVDTLEIATTYRVRNDGCIIFWETENVEGQWELLFEQLN